MTVTSTRHAVQPDEKSEITEECTASDRAAASGTCGCLLKSRPAPGSISGAALIRWVKIHTLVR